MSKNLIRFSKIGIMDENTKEVVVQPEYEDLEIIPDKCIIFQKDQKQGILDMNGNEVISNLYDDIRPFEKVLVCYIGTLAAVIDYSGKTILDLGYSYVKVEDDVIIATKNDKTGAFDYNGNAVVALKYKEIVVEDDFLLMTYDDGNKVTHEIMNYKTNEKIIDLSSENQLIGYYKDIVIYKKNDKYGAINLNTKEIILDTRYEDIGINVNIQLLKVKLGGIYCVMNYDGQIKIPYRYTKINLHNDSIEGVIGKNIEKYDLPLKIN